MTPRCLAVAVLAVSACAARGRSAPTPPSAPTYASLAGRCGITVGALDSLLADASSKVRAQRHIDIAPDAFGAILSTRLPASSSRADCPAIADTIARTLMQGGR